jgi:hypothetical protein
LDPEHPTAAALAQYATASKERISVDRQIEARVNGLLPPAQERALWQQLRRLIVAVEQNNIAQIQAAARGDAVAFVADYLRTVRLGTSLRAAGARAGFDSGSSCARIF